ncbi:MAG: VTT domain-containing protein [Acidobacteriota bacterium]
MHKLRQIVLAGWAVLIVGALFLYLFDEATLKAIFARILAQPKPLAGAIFFLILCFRGFILIPAGYLVIAAIPVLPAVPLFFLTLGGVMVSSGMIYLFSQAMHLDEFFERKHKAGIEKVRQALQRYEMPIIIAWSFLPLVPTDVICYVCGSLKINFKKFLLGILIGEGSICAVYIFLGDSVLRLLSMRP